MRFHWCDVPSIESTHGDTLSRIGNLFTRMDLLDEGLECAQKALAYKMERIHIIGALLSSLRHCLY